MTKAEVNKVIDALGREFMRPEFWRDDVWVVETSIGTEYVPASVLNRPGLHVHNTGITGADLAPYVEGTVQTDSNDNPIAELKIGTWCARLSAPGYLDATDLAIFDTEDQAREYIAETYGDDLDEIEGVN